MREIRSIGKRLEIEKLSFSANHLGLLLWMIGLAWVVQIIDLFLFRQVNLDVMMGVTPRSVSGLTGVLASPFKHMGFKHLIGNTFPWLVLGGLTCMGEKKKFLKTTFILVITSGLGTWLIGRDATHVGSSGLIYGYFGYVLGAAWYVKRPFWILVAIIALVFYGKFFLNVLPVKDAISWEAHLAGLVSGVWLARRTWLRGLNRI